MRLIFCLTLLAALGCSETETMERERTEAAAIPTTESIESPVQDVSLEETIMPTEIVIDVRSQEEWDTEHLERAVHIPHTEIAERIAEVTDDKDAKIVVHCAVGGRAGKAKEALEALGFTNVENAGGLDDVKARFQ